jgi:hypothetical protein
VSIGERANETARARVGSQPALRARPRWLCGGGIDGNEELTAITGILLIALLAALGITILRIRQLIWLHLFLGLLLLGPVALKVASTAYRFVRYYTRDAVYRAKGPPMPLLRAIGPVVVAMTAAVFSTGIVLLFNGPRHRGTWVGLHKATFVLWLASTGIHVLAHLPSLGRSARAVRIAAERSGEISATSSGAVGRWLALSGMLVAGAVLAILLIPHVGAWTAPGAFPHHHGDG